MERKRKSVEFERMAEASDQGNESDASDREKELSVEDFDKKSSEIAEAKALMKDKLPKEFSGEVKVESSDENVEDQPEGILDNQICFGGNLSLVSRNDDFLDFPILRSILCWIIELL